MRKITAILFSVLFILSFNTNVHAQLIKLGVGGGLTQILGPDHYTRDISNAGFGFSSEYNLGIIAKVGLPIIPLTPRAFFNYHNLNSEGTPPMSLFKGNDLDNAAEYSQSIFTLGLGVQYGFIPVPVGFDPYLSFDLTFNNFGDFKTIFNGNENVFDGFSRLGLQVGLGTEVTILPMLNLDVFAGYNWFNLTGKDDNEKTVTAFVLDVYLMFSFL
jgi:Outer membrane protein beta-barrel domain